MELTVKYGTNAPKGFLKEVYELDKEVYSPTLCGLLENLEKRYAKCKDSFILIYNGDEIAGYLNMFPVGKSLYDELNDPKKNILRDDDITPEEMVDWEKDKLHHLFIISIVVREKYRGGETVKLLGNSALEFLREKHNSGYLIGSISGTAISEGGANFLKRLRGGFVKYVYEKGDNIEEKSKLPHEEKDRYYRTDGENLKELLGDKGLLIYKKTYKDDLYFYLPMMSKTGKDPREQIKQFVDKESAKSTSDNFGKLYCDAMKDHTEYECSNDFFRKNIERFYLGEYPLICYNDNYYESQVDYYGEIEDSEKVKTVIELQKSHLFLTAHKESGLYILTIAIPNNKYITTQLIDQMSQGIFDLMIGNNRLDICKFAEEKFGLIRGGEAKCVACLSNEPEDKTELAYILAGETYVSSKIDYRIIPGRLEKLLTPKECYDYYKLFISRSVVTYVFRDFNDIEERLEYEASVLFIVGIVLLQNTAVSRTNSRVVEALTDNAGITNEEIEEIYVEFGKTMKFWDSNIYCYPFSQKEADEVIESFGIKHELDEYYRNQSFLDRMIEIKTSITTEKSDRITNTTLYILSWAEGGAGFISLSLWFSKLFGGELNLLDFNLWLELGVGIFLLGSALFVAAKADILGKRKRRNKKKKK